jgi:putative SOS response-associated peptidase YedK
MCYHLSLSAPSEEIEMVFNALFDGTVPFQAIYHASGFAHPHWPVITNNDPGTIAWLRWGLIPAWVKSGQQAAEIARQTLNARAETLWEKPSFRDAARKRHCLVLADGFFEWQTQPHGKQPYYIRLPGGRCFACAGLWEEWRDPTSGRVGRSFSIITTTANPLLARIHNSKQRMPVILRPESYGAWLSTTGDSPERMSILAPYPAAEMEAWPVSHLLASRRGDSNCPAVQERQTAPEQPE